jgi:hypothetical protein
MTNYKQLYETAKKKGTLKQRTPEFIKFEEPGQTVIGEFVSANTVKSSLNDGNYNQYIFQTDDGLVKFSLGAASDAELEAVLIQGCIYGIEFLGNEKISGGRSVNKFNVVEINEFETEKANGKKNDKKQDQGDNDKGN